MKKRLLYLILLLSLNISLCEAQTFTWSPEFFDEDESVSLTVSNFNPQTEWGASDIYLWAWHIQDDGTQINNPSATGSDFGNSPETAKFVNNGDGTFTYNFGVLTSFYNNTGIDKIGFLLKNQNGSNQTGDNLKNVGVFQLILTSPQEDTTIINAGETFNITASTGAQNANFQLIGNGNSVNTQNNSTNYNFNIVVNQTTDFVLTATNLSTNEVLTESFTAFVAPNPDLLPVPAGAVDGANLDFPNMGDITLVLYGEGKAFIHLIGDFNNWQLDDNFLLNFDASLNKHWITVPALANQNTVLYQYLVEGTIQVADPYATLILDEFNDGFIETVTFANIPSYPVGQTSNPVTWLRPNQSEYVWQTNNFTPPAKEDLVIYELLLRDFDDGHSFDDVVSRLDYLEDLGVNAIELMPVNEFDGNLSWGYNPAFHQALDKYYGSPENFKAMIDACHERGIAVIIDVVYNQGTGQHPFYRMYNTDNGGTGGQASADSPFFNPVPTHSYSVFNDFNHQSLATQEYVEQTLQYWLDEYRLDGFRFDLTKGFTQNCLNNESCTNNYNQDRVDVLKQYADAAWDANDDAFIIFEHLGFGGSRDEEIEWSNHRLNEGKGILFWNKFSDPYNEATMGYHENGKSNFNSMDWQTIGLNAPRSIGYMESHDEERLMYKNLAFGNSSGSYDVTQLDTALNRMEAAGAFFFTIPGPKMIWQFGEMGYDISIFQCEDGSIPEPYGTDTCRTGNKPDGWNYLSDTNRTDIYNTWATLIDFKKNLPIFKTENFTISSQSTNGLKQIYLTDDNASGSVLKYVVILGNFGVTAQNITPSFPETGSWFNMFTNEEVNVTNTSASINLSPGEFLMFSSESTLGLEAKNAENLIQIYPNPANNYFRINKSINSLQIFDVTGKSVKSFKGDFTGNDDFDISDLTQGLYLVKIENLAGASSTTKLIKQ